ncbi:MAG: hypothetical protein ACYCXF_02175 [Thermoleophilia bacterium]
MARIEIEGGRLRVVVEGLDKVLAVKTHIDVPLAHVRGAHPDPEAARGSHGLKMPGARVPGLITAGSFRKEGEWTFFDVHDPDHALVIELDHEHYTRLVVEVDDPSSTASIINEALNKTKKEEGNK